MEIAREDIVNTTGNDKVIVKELDLSSMECVKQFAKDIFETENRRLLFFKKHECCETIMQAYLQSSAQWKTPQNATWSQETVWRIFYALGWINSIIQRKQSRNTGNQQLTATLSKIILQAKYYRRNIIYFVLQLASHLALVLS